MTDFERLLAALPQPPEYRYDWDALRALPAMKDVLARMAQTPQNPVWHGEGDVRAHTMKVCATLADMADFRAQPEDARQALALAALLHDVGKIATTRWQDGRWRSPHHASVGAQMARKLLWQDFGLCGEGGRQRFREAVCLLIRCHGVPEHLVEDPMGPQWALRLASDGQRAPLCTLERLCLLAEADVRGRIAPDIDALCEAIHLARMLGQDEGCLTGPYPFASARTQRALFSGGRVWKDQALYDDSWGEVMLLCGLPGTGKDTWLQTYQPGLPTVCLDDIRRDLGLRHGDDPGRVVQEAKVRARRLLAEHTPFAWNATCLTVQRREPLIELFEAYHARVRVVFLETEWAENLRRNAGRSAAVPEGTLENMLGRLEPPRPWEAQRVDWICV